MRDRVHVNVVSFYFRPHKSMTCQVSRKPIHWFRNEVSRRILFPSHLRFGRIQGTPAMHNLVSRHALDWPASKFRVLIEELEACYAYRW